MLPQSVQPLKNVHLKSNFTLFKKAPQQPFTPSPAKTQSEVSELPLQLKEFIIDKNMIDLELYANIADQYQSIQSKRSSSNQLNDDLSSMRSQIVSQQTSHKGQPQPSKEEEPATMLGKIKKYLAPKKLVDIKISADMDEKDPVIFDNEFRSKLTIEDIFISQILDKMAKYGLAAMAPADMKDFNDIVRARHESLSQMKNSIIIEKLLRIKKQTGSRLAAGSNPEDAVVDLLSNKAKALSLNVHSDNYEECKPQEPIHEFFRLKMQSLHQKRQKSPSLPQTEQNDSSSQLRTHQMLLPDQLQEDDGETLEPKTLYGRLFCKTSKNSQNLTHLRNQGAVSKEAPIPSLEEQNSSLSSSKYPPSNNVYAQNIKLTQEHQLYLKNKFSKNPESKGPDLTDTLGDSMKIVSYKTPNQLIAMGKQPLSSDESQSNSEKIRLIV